METRTVGTRLREARRELGITLQQISAETRLSVKTLELVERNEFERLPGGLFTRSYLRAYASAVGLDPNDVVRLYLEQCPVDATDELPALRTPAEGEPHPLRLVLVEALAIVLALVVYVSVRDAGEAPPAPPAAVELDGSAQPPGEPLPVMADAARAEPASLGFDSQLQRLELEIQPTGACWVSVIADDEQVVYRLVQGGERVVVTARRELLLRVGDPGTFEYRLNGRPGRPLGLQGRPVTVRIGATDYETFLATPNADRPA